MDAHRPTLIEPAEALTSDEGAAHDDAGHPEAQASSGTEAAHSRSGAFDAALRTLANPDLSGEWTAEAEQPPVDAQGGTAECQVGALTKSAVLADVLHTVFGPESQSSEDEAEPDAPAAAKGPDAHAIQVTRAAQNRVFRQVIGARVRAARELNGLSQHEAAAALGYANSTQVCLIEAGERLPPLPLVVVMARVFAVPVDFLVGVTSDPEPDPVQATRRVLMRRVEDLLRANVAAVTDALMTATRQDLPAHMEAIARSAQRLVEAVQRVSELNPIGFAELRGGATVLHRADLLTAAIGTTRAALRDAERAIHRHTSTNRGKKR